MERLSSGAEQLLKEIIEHRNENGACDLDYWRIRFEKLETNFSLEVRVRNQFGILHREGMIDVQWASDIPYTLFVLDPGLAYYENEMKGCTEHMEDVKVFVSYNQQSGSQFVDALQQKLEGKATLLRDKTHIESWGSISGFMHSIRDQDFAVAVINDSYLRSQACMFEIATMMREENWQKRVIPAVLDSTIYSRKLEYVEYWETKKRELEEKAKNVSGLSIIQALGKDAEEVNKICAEIGTFLTFVLDSKNPPIYSVLDEIEKRVLLSSRITPIPQEAKDKIESSRIREDLSNFAQQLLVKAGKAQKRIIFTQDMSGYSLGLDGENGERAFDDRTASLWQEAITKLQEFKLIEQTDSKGQIFRLTHRGYEMADKFEIQLQQQRILIEHNDS